ncbi:Uncharacterized conserved protein [Phaffia rhodozyma]|uniref:Uncharacterized conserved protein n=1 Tax=Phaffia rhodozyma TaxID=264483 RepID=A0A0F7SXB7_PHARH|nr:Uncharacterized conserved protein [Phaffia rhodozyma]
MSSPTPTRSSDELADEKKQLESGPTSNEASLVEGAGAAPVKTWWFRGTIFQAVIVGLCSFLSPGTWNAMSATGAGGAQSPYLVNAANALVFGLMVFFCSMGTSLSNKIGLKWSLAIGCIGYAPYAAGLYVNKIHGTVWLVLFGATTCGISAGIFWSVEGAIILGYPEARKRGIYLAVWLAFKSGGQLLGGIINTALNIRTKVAGSVSSKTYLVFIALECLSPFVALLLSEPHKVQREDGTPVVVGTNKEGFKKEMRLVGKTFLRKEVLLLSAFAFYSSLMGPYQSTFLSLYFTVRTRALASLLSAILGVSVNFMLGIFLDSRRFTLATRARVSFLIVTAMMLASWVWGLVIQIQFSKRAKAPSLDFGSPDFARAYCLYLLYALNTSVTQNVLYFYIGAISSADQSDIGRLSSILRALESAGSAVGYGITARKTLPHSVPLGIDVAVWGLSTIPAWFSIKEIGVSLSGGYKAEDGVPAELEQKVIAKGEAAAISGPL